MPADRKMILQIHYNLLNGSGSDRTTIQMDLADQVDRVGTFSFFGNAGGGSRAGTIPAGEKAYDYSLETPNLLRRDLKLWQVFPHMHAFGRKQKLELTLNSKKICAMDVPQWDYNWQFVYNYKQPISIGENDNIKLTCTYNTEGETGPIKFGEGTQDEMCLIGLLTTDQ